MDYDLNSCKWSLAELLDKLSSQMWIVRDLVSKLPTGSGESLAGHSFYVSQSDYDRLLKD